MKHKPKIESFRVFLNNPNSADLVLLNEVEFLDMVKSNGWQLERGMKVKSTKYHWESQIERFFKFKETVYVYFKNPRVRNAFGKISPNHSDKEVQGYKLDELFLSPLDVKI